jgi:hypothetical protein
LHGPLESRLTAPFPVLPTTPAIRDLDFTKFYRNGYQ